MDAFVTRKKRKSSPTIDSETTSDIDVEESTDVKLALLSSLHPSFDQESLLDILLAHDGSVSAASASLYIGASPGTKSNSSSSAVAQSSLRLFATSSSSSTSAPLGKKPKLLSRKGRTLFLYDPVDIAEHTPCTVIHNFLPVEEANDLLRELLQESETYEKITFKLFENVVTSPHTSSFYVGTYEEMHQQKYEYLYNGAKLADVRQLTPKLQAVKPKVQEAVNKEVQDRIKNRYPNGKKLKHQSPKPWVPNAAFVNCYDGPQESVGWHSDQLTYLGPRAIIGSLSLGVAREFRVRRVVARDDAKDKPAEGAGAGDAEGQISIHLPHNSLLVMHAEMQEEWKHSISPAQSVEPHPVGGNKRINVTYRDYKASLHPSLTPRCGCGVPTVLRVVQRKRENRGRYFWMCHAGNVPGKEGCPFFQWAEFDDDGDPVWGAKSSKEETKGKSDAA